jgi:hypothetical protein
MKGTSDECRSTLRTQAIPRQIMSCGKRGDNAILEVAAPNVGLVTGCSNCDLFSQAVLSPLTKV